MDTSDRILRVNQQSLIDPDILNQIYEDISRDYYVSTDWSMEFYVLQAVRGFIAVSHVFPDGTAILLPEMQTSYCVFDWKSLEGHRRLKKQIASELSDYRIKTNSRPIEVLESIQRYHAGKSWLCPEYRNLCDMLFRAETLRIGALPGMGEGTVFRFCSVEFYNTNDELVAGEIGYVIGSVYTSLTGFCQRESRISFGKVQILALAKLLERNGFDFLNLGQPPREGKMLYKSELGGKEVSRKDFISRWSESIQRTPERLNAFLSSDSQLGTLFVD